MTDVSVMEVDKGLQNMHRLQELLNHIHKQLVDQLADRFPGTLFVLTDIRVFRVENGVKVESGVKIDIILGMSVILQDSEVSRILERHKKYGARGLQAMEVLIKRRHLSIGLALTFYMRALVTSLGGLCNASGWTREIAKHIYGRNV